MNHNDMIYIKYTLYTHIIIQINQLCVAVIDCLYIDIHLVILNLICVDLIAFPPK